MKISRGETTASSYYTTNLIEHLKHENKHNDLVASGTRRHLTLQQMVARAIKNVYIKIKCKKSHLKQNNKAFTAAELFSEV